MRVQSWESLGSGRAAVEPPYYRTPTLIGVKTELLSSEEGSRRASKHSRAAADALSVLLSHSTPKGQIDGELV
jgi:hypothetical protein